MSRRRLVTVNSVVLASGKGDFMRRRVVVTGMGCINPLGNDVETMWTGVKEGRSGVGYTTIFDASKFPTKISAEIKNWDITETGEDAEIWKYRGRHTKFACGAAKQAVQQSGILDAEPRPDADRRLSGLRRREPGFRVVLAHDDRRPDARRRRSGDVRQDGAGNPQSRRRDRARAEHAGRAMWPACSTPKGRTPTASPPVPASSQAIGEATEIIRRGDADVMLSGGATA